MGVSTKFGFYVNGVWREAWVRPDRLLVDFLREDLGLTGTKKGCEEGSCGACTVIMDGRAVLSCLIPVAKADGGEIWTVEGLAQGATLDPLQKAFLEEGAVQCGYCTPGMLMSAKALLDDDPEPSERRIREALSGNLCRCTGYTKIVRAIHSTSRQARKGVPSHSYEIGSLPEAAGPHVVGKSIARRDATDKVTGQALYAGDLVLPGLLHVRVFRSDRPHGKILRIQTEAAEHQPGVTAVLTHKDIPGSNRIGSFQKDQPILCDDKVRYVGDPIALVVAETPEAAESALKMIHVDYEELPGVFSPERALEPDAPLIHKEGNLLQERTLLKGDPDKGLQESEVVITETYRTQMVEHAYLEPEAAVASFEKGEKDEEPRLTIRMPSKYAHADRMEIASVLALPPNRLRIINMEIGGYFGDKTSLSPGFYVALATWKTGRPSKMIYSREESFIATRKRHPFIMRYTTGASRDGRLIAVKAEILADTGAYAASGPTVLVKSLIHAVGPYVVPHVRVDERFVYTNNPVGGSMRGLGVPQVAFAHESQMDLLAQRLRMDPFEIRLKNALRPGEVTATGQTLGESVGLVETLASVRAEITKRGTPAPCGSKRYGWGIASMIYGIGLAGRSNPSGARIEVDEKGCFTLYVGVGEGGQGSFTVLSQIAAEALGVSVEAIRVVGGDTDSCPDSGVMAGSRVTYTLGRSVQMAAEKLSEVLLGTAASMMEVPPDSLSFANGHYTLSNGHRRALSLERVVERMKEQGISPWAEASFDPPIKALDPGTAQGHPMATYGYATQAALVGADLDSGEIDVHSVIACHDVGKAVNPMSVTGQIEGAISMGLGYSLMEEVLLDRGAIRNPKLREYFIPTSLDMPEITSLLVECAEPTGPFGAKGVGEPALIPTAPAIINAIDKAAGIRVKELPVTSEALWRLLKKKGNVF